MLSYRHPSRACAYVMGALKQRTGCHIGELALHQLSIDDGTCNFSESDFDSLLC
jgi:hypothetical protein